MEEYVNQLIEDIRDAARLAPEPFLFSTNDAEFMTQMAESENTLPISSEKLMGLMYLQFPPCEKLTKEHMMNLIKELENTLAAFRIFIELPDAVPVELRYEMIRGSFKEKLNVRKGMNLHLDFCTGVCPPCQIAEYCPINIQNKKK